MSGKRRPFKIDASGPLDEAALVVREGGVIAYPTETSYGLGVDPFNPEAIEKLFALKGRSEENPLSVIVADKVMLRRFALEVSPFAETLIRKFWPGPLTLVMKARPEVPKSLLAGTGKVGVRISSSPVCKRLLSTLSGPVTATSANPSGKPPATSAEEVVHYFGPSVDLVVDGGRLAGKLPSTVVDVSGPGLEIIREGAVPASDLTSCLEGSG